MISTAKGSPAITALDQSHHLLPLERPRKCTQAPARDPRNRICKRHLRLPFQMQKAKYRSQHREEQAHAKVALRAAAPHDELHDFWGGQTLEINLRLTEVFIEKPARDRLPRPHPALGEAPPAPEGPAETLQQDAARSG